MNNAMKKQIISELDSLPDRKGYSLLDYLHFLKNEKENYIPNQQTVEAIKDLDENRDSLTPYNSSDDLFNDLGIEV
jgi:hypothetical protein